MFDIDLAYDPRVDAGVVIDRIVRRFPQRYAIELDVVRQTRLDRAIHGPILVARIARSALVGLSVRVKHDEEGGRTRLVTRTVIPSRRTFLFLAVMAPLMLVVYPMVVALSFAIRRDVRNAMRSGPHRSDGDGPPSARTVVTPVHASAATDVYGATVPYDPIRGRRRRSQFDSSQEVKV